MSRGQGQALQAQSDPSDLETTVPFWPTPAECRTDNAPKPFHTDGDMTGMAVRLRKVKKSKNVNRQPSLHIRENACNVLANDPRGSTLREDP